MADKDVEIRDAIGYSFPGLEAFPYIEELIDELGLESERYWMRPATREDCFAKGDWVILRQQPNPVLLDEYELQYDIPYDDSNINKVMFLEYLVDTMLEYIGYLEGCLEKEMEEE
jgi:hypothetical protein